MLNFEYQTNNPLTRTQMIKHDLELDLMRANLAIKELTRLLNEEKIKCGQRGRDLKVMRAKLSGRGVKKS